MLGRILEKNDYSYPSWPKRWELLNRRVDNTVHPYNGFYRGVYDSEQPVIFERKGGYRNPYDVIVDRKRNRSQYKSIAPHGITELKTIFEHSCKL